MLRRTLPLILAAALAAPAAARAEAPLGLTECGPAEGVYQCSGLVETWDGVPLDVTLALPRAGARDLPLVVQVAGFGNSKWEYMNPANKGYIDTIYRWARRGYAALAYSERGLWGSCGTPEARAANPAACADGYLHLADVRYEVRDPQTLIGLLVDEGVADSKRLAVIGESYGGGQALMLAALGDRVMLPDGRLVPWRSPAGTRLRLAVAASVIPWVDLIYAAAPNGRVFAEAITPRSVATDPVGVEKATFVNGILAAAQFAVGPGQPIDEPFIPGRPMGYLAPPGTDPEADVAGWVARTNAGEPYADPGARAIVDLLARYHSPYYVDASHSPPPLFLAAGINDDLFPPDEVLRFANRTRHRYPDLPLSVLLGDFGHQRAANKPRDRRALLRGVHRWVDHHLAGAGRPPRQGVTAFALTCPRPQPSGGPYRAPSFAQLSRGEVRRRFDGEQTISSAAGDPTVGKSLDPVSGSGNACTELDAATEPGTATYELPVRREDGLTLIGAPTVSADLEVSGAAPHDAQVAGRLWSVDPEAGTRRLITRGTYRPQTGGRDLWQLHPTPARLAAGDLITLELLGRDAPYARPSNEPFEITVSDLRLRLPVRERADCHQVRGERPAPLLPGMRLAPGAKRLARAACH